MSYEIVHTIGSTVYFVFFLLFLWVRRTPRINPGAGALVAACRIGGGNMGLRHVGRRVAGVAAQCGRGAVQCRFSRSCRVDCVEPAQCSGAVVVVVVVDGVDQRVAGAALGQCVPDIDRHPGWFTQGFVLGTALVLTQYFSLLAAVLLSFQKRLMEAESRALYLAFQDPLTGLSNQRYMRTLFENALILANRPHQQVAVVFIDIDNFKPVNDRAGHRVGDEVLKEMAARLRTTTRSTDICARIGGDEFVAICTQLESEERAHDIARKLLKAFTELLLIEGREYLLGASIGISLYPRHGTTLAELLECADRAMYQIKGGGKNGYRIHAAGEPRA